ncbi:MAG TPA: hypothetical protein VGM78_04200, partial [Ilumatobacteraceae bacterium]
MSDQPRPNRFETLLDVIAARAHEAADGGARADLARATRSVIAELMSSSASDDVLEQASALVAQAASLLNDHT